MLKAKAYNKKETENGPPKSHQTCFKTFIWVLRVYLATYKKRQLSIMTEDTVL